MNKHNNIYRDLHIVTAIHFCAVILIFASMFIVASCGSSSNDDNNTVLTPPPFTPPPITTPVSEPPPGFFNVHLHAEVGVSSVYQGLNGDRGPEFTDFNLRDFKLGRGHVWLSDRDGPAAWAELRFPCEVEVVRVRLWDSNTVGHNLQGGLLEFFNDNGSTQSMPDMTVNALPDNGATPGDYPVNNYKVTRIRLGITDFRDVVLNSEGQVTQTNTPARSGLAEFQVHGRYAPECELNSSLNLAPYAHTSSIVHVRERIEGTIDTGLYRTHHVADDPLFNGSPNGENSWQSDGAGANARLTLQWKPGDSIDPDRTMNIDRVVLHNFSGPELPRFTRIELEFDDGSVETMVQAASTPSMTFNFSPPKESNNITVSIKDYLPGNGNSGQDDTGLREIQVYGGLDPSTSASP